MDRLIILQQVKDRILTQEEAGKRLGITTRQIRRLLVRIHKEGLPGVKSKHKGGNRLFAPEFKVQILKTVSERYQGFGPTLASEKLKEVEGLKINKETLRQWMILANLWQGRSRKRARIHQSRERRARFGELVQIDGSHHDWFEGRAQKCCLLVFIDDATSRILGLFFHESETKIAYMALVEQHIKAYGRPLAYYSDRHSIFKTTREHSVDGRFEDTEFRRALRELSIELICAHSSQAKGRVERANQTLQDRLVKELRLRGICSIAEANTYVPEFIKDYNQRFGVVPISIENAHRDLHFDSATLRRILSVHTQRKLSKNLEFSLDHKIYQIITPTTGYRLRHKAITLCEHIDGTQEVICGKQLLAFKILEARSTVHMADTKELNLIVDRLVKENSELQMNLPAGFLTVNQDNHEVEA